MSKVQMLTGVEREQRIKELLAFSSIELESKPKAFYHEKLKGLITGYSKMKKAELVDAVKDIISSYKESIQRKAADYLDAFGDSDFSYDMVVSFYHSKVSPNGAAETIYQRIQANKPTDTTLAKSKPKQLRLVLDKIRATAESSSGWCDAVYESFQELIMPVLVRVNQDYKQTNETRTAEDFMRVDGEVVLNWARETIEWAASQDNLERGWHKVSLALALTSGRRQGEIHGTTAYELVDSSHIKATGLLKKSSDDFELTFHCLTDANLWMQALNNLPEKRRNQPNSRVNSTIRPAISGSIGSKIAELGFKTYSNSRDFYINYHIDRFFDRQTHGTETSYVKNLVGHSTQRIAVSYIKMFTK